MTPTGGLTNPRPWRGRCRAGSSKTGGPPLPQKRAPYTKKYDPRLCQTDMEFPEVLNNFSSCLFSTVSVYEKKSQIQPRPQDGSNKIKWSVKMPPPDESFLPDNCTLSIKTNVGSWIRTLRFTFGDIWFCAGQSNMRWPLKFLSNRSYPIAEGNNFIYCTIGSSF